MRWALWIIGLFALAVAVAIGLRVSAGYVLLVFPPYRVELSLNLLLLLLVAGFVLGYVLVRLIFGAIELPARVREFRARREREGARAMLLDALRAFFEGRYGRAEKAAATVMESGESPALAAVLAARAAHELRHNEQRDGYLERASRLAPDDTVMRVIAAADMLLDQRRFQEALVVLKSLPEKHTAGLRLELKAQQQAKNWEGTLPLLDQLERRGVFDAKQAGELRRYAYAENLRRNALDKRSLDECWQKVPGHYKRDAKVAAAAVQRYLELGACTQVNQIIEQALEAEWDSGLIGLYGDCASSETIRQIEYAEKWLVANPGDAILLLVLGKLCARQELWGKAQSYLEASIAVEPSFSAHLVLARLHEQIGKPEAARRHFRESLDLAIHQLGQSSGGRRRTAF